MLVARVESAQFPELNVHEASFFSTARALLPGLRCSRVSLSASYLARLCPPSRLMPLTLRDADIMSADARGRCWSQGGAVLRLLAFFASCASCPPAAYSRTGMAALQADRAEEHVLSGSLVNLYHAEARAAELNSVLRVLVLLPLLRGGNHGILAARIVSRPP